MHRTRHKIVLKIKNLLAVISRHWAYMAVIVYALLTILLIRGPYFRLHHFQCRTTGTDACPDFVIPELEKLQGRLSYLRPYEDIKKRFQTNLPGAQSIEIQSVWPDQAVMTIKWQQPAAYLSTAITTSAYIVSSQGQLMKVVEQPGLDLPVIIASSAADLILSDQLTDSGLITALQAVKLLSQTSYPAQQVNVVSLQNIRIRLQNQVNVIVTALKPIERQVLALQLIMAKDTINSAVSEIDVRYDRPVLKSKP